MDLHPCASAPECDGRSHGDCAAGETGSWACVQTACIWNCEAEEPPQPDAGTGGSGGSSGTGGSSGVVDGGAEDGSSGSGGDASGSTGTSKAGSSDEEGGGCACRQSAGAGRSGVTGLLGLLIAGAVLLRGRREGTASGLP